ncbi:M20 family metallopeptidase [Corynebacterium epidermidicanis]|uniref:Peptidase M20 domain-containing protein 2 n=1 Tax=Corynebacterium epidermidicanis TaxID=1050174 RepID=A0A0G3GXX6_9CORY|nr:M20 family metallopeptidase [Corynebacterium epidermidicanis]AKK03667.1 amidohydrolase [Corynebacterium epidermidicanis]
MDSRDRLTPSTAFIDELNASVHRAMAETSPAQPPQLTSYPEQTQLWAAATTAVESMHTELEQLSLDIHAHPEVAFTEKHAVAAITEVLRNHGVVATAPAFGLDTAIHAEVGTGKVAVAFLSEYDALPEIGHACGHNLIASAGVGAFLATVAAVREVGREDDVRIVFLGTPAEEGHSGKEYLIRGGAFEGLDAAVMVHPFDMDIASHAWIGRRSATVTFHGVSAHASSQPFMGRNALDAATLLYQGLGLLRQQMPPSDRLHAVISEGGQRPSVIPDTSTVELYVRSLHSDTLVDLSARVTDVCRGAALMTGCSVDIAWDPHPPTLPVRNNQALAQRWRESQAQQGVDALPAGVVPESIAASTDFGNVSQLVPGIHPLIKIAPEGVALHTEQLREAAASPEGLAAMRRAATSLAHVGLDVLFDREFRSVVHAEFVETGPQIRVNEIFP